MQIDPDVVAIIAVATAGACGVLLIVVLVLALRLRALHRRYEVAIGDAPAEDLVAAVATQARSLKQVASDLRTVHGNTETLRELHRGAVSRLGLVRYDAFPDMGGMLSFSAALLDERGDGIVLSAINGRQETRSYGKPIREGTSEHSLSDEEQEAVRAALAQGRSGTLAAPGGERRRR